MNEQNTHLIQKNDRDSTYNNTRIKTITNEDERLRQALDISTQDVKNLSDQLNFQLENLVLEQQEHDKTH